MLLNTDEIKNIVKNINITGVLHVGAHDCQELPFYTDKLKINKEAIVWIDALESKVELGKQNGNKVYHAVITDTDDAEITFNISNNEQSSSILDFKTHAIEHPEVKFVKTITQKSITIDTFFSRNNINPEIYNFWNFDIQGAELLALKGATNAIQFAKAIYLEVNKDELYKGCALINEIDDFLKGYGFNRVLTNMTRFGWGDALYLK
jgi:FkbM family methyltransferase